ncbi:replication-relaxation family protein [Marmoricola sp. URHB0036]|uniref:replication-relaxation family protein n=1 Tax=Marmoricola sp. URHB0036 TaxID=1298863 RepID=UPI0018C93696|nr:replication-relaxation family protein [Marmoricola sp. URHB0036]
MRALQPDDLSPRDRAILRDLARVRLLTGAQLERLHFSGLTTGNARGSARRRSLGRLGRAGLVTTLPRRVGGVHAGSAGLIYTLDARAHRERPLWDPESIGTDMARVRRPWAIGWMFIEHTLDVAEFYVRAREAEWAATLHLIGYDAEPASWFSAGNLTIKPDAYLAIEAAGWERHWWLEVDRATESLPTIRRKLSRYLALFQQGSPGPAGVLPQVLVTAPVDRRVEQLRDIVTALAAPEGFITVSTFARAVELIPGEQARPPP